MGFSQVRLNLPGMSSYDPTRPRIVKWNKHLTALAGDAITFVDDVRIVGSTKEHCRDTYRQFTSRMQYLGFQDAPRKFRPPSQDNAGAWTGTIFRVTANEVTKSVAQEKWDKGRLIIQTLIQEGSSSDNHQPLLTSKDLERYTGFLNHLAMTFEEPFSQKLLPHSEFMEALSECGGLAGTRSRLEGVSADAS